MVRSAFVLALLFPVLASAQVIISEIMYDLAEGSDSGREWIEVYNADVVPLTLSEYIIFENKSKHKIASDSSLPPGGFAVIADKPERFRADHPNYLGLVFDSAFSLNNNGESIEIRRGETVLDAVSYVKSLGGNGSGESLQRTTLSSGAAFTPGAPTPGASIPASGLVRVAPPKEKAPAKITTTARAPEVLGAQIVRESFMAFELETETAGISMWLLGVGAIAGVGITGALLGRRHDELDDWTIIEEV